MISRELVHNPIDHALQGLGFHSTPGFANGRQRPPSPVLRTGLLQRAYQETVRCADEIHVAGLPLAAAHLPAFAPAITLQLRHCQVVDPPSQPVTYDHGDAPGTSRWEVKVKTAVAGVPDRVNLEAAYVDEAGCQRYLDSEYLPRNGKREGGIVSWERKAMGTTYKMSAWCELAAR